MKTQKCIATVGILAVFAIALGVFAACDNGTSPPGDNIDVPPENLPVAERWGKWVGDDATATLDYSVDSDGVCTIIIGGNATDRWEVSASYPYTAKANTNYSYSIEAWTESGTRDLTFQYYWEDDQTWITADLQIDSDRKTYTIKGESLPKGGKRYLTFQCADQLGTFYVKILSIDTYTPSLEYELIDNIDSPNNGTYRVISATRMSGAVEIPATYNDLPVTEIGDSAFESTNITAVTIPASVTEIGAEAFAHCYSLTNITIPASVTSIGSQAFAYCYSLTSVTIPEGVTDIRSRAFAWCTSLTSIIIPASVRIMSHDVFYDWTASQTIYVRASQAGADATWESDWREGCNATIKYWNGSEYQ